MKEIDPKIKQFIISVGIALGIISMSMNLIQFFFGQSLDDQIELRNLLISEKDSTFTKILNDQKINDSLYKSYIGPGAIEYGGDSVNIEDIVNLTSDIISKNSKCQDSLIIYRSLLRALDKQYGKNFAITSENGYVKTLKLFNKADSALLLFPYYKNKITLDKNGNINIETQPKTTKDKDGNSVTTVETRVIIFESVLDTLKNLK